MHAHVDEDLLKPVLEPGLDVRTFRAPWNPWGILWVAYFGGALGAGALYALNERRIGRPRRSRGILIVAVALTLSWALAAYVVANDPRFELAPKEFNSTFMVVSQFSALAFSYFVARRQSARVKLWRATGRPLGKLLWVAVLASILNAVLIVEWLRVCA